MGGTLRGKIDAYINTGSRYTNIQNAFKNIYDFCIAHPNMTLIARNGGNGGGAANVNYHDETNPFLSNAWFVVRMNDATLENGSANPTGYSGPRTFPWYMYVQWTRFDQLSWNSAPASPGAVDNSTNFGGSWGTLGVQFCIAAGSIAGTSEAAWNGGGSLGTNTKGTPVWRTTPGTPTGYLGSYVHPRANGPGGTYATNKENSMSMYAMNFDSPGRQHILADDDNILFLFSDNDDNIYVATYFGLYTVKSGLSITYPMVSFNDAIPLAANTLFGTTNGASRNGGITWNSVTDNVRGMMLGRPDEWNTQQTQPNNNFAAERYDEFNIPVMGNENPTYFGLAGAIDFVREVYDVKTNDGNATRSRVFLGTDLTGETKLSVPWKADAASPVGAIVPRSNFLNRAGTSFP